MPQGFVREEYVAVAVDIVRAGPLPSILDSADRSNLPLPRREVLLAFPTVLAGIVVGVAAVAASVASAAVAAAAADSVASVAVVVVVVASGWASGAAAFVEFAAHVAACLNAEEPLEEVSSKGRSPKHV